MNTLSEQDMLVLRVHVEKHWQSGCPMCGSRTWTVSGYLMLSLSPSFTQVALGGPGLPVVPVVCTTCGNTVLVNAIVAGVLPRSSA